MTLYYIIWLWLFLVPISLELISRKKNGMNDIYDLYNEWGKLNTFWSKAFVIVYLMVMLPFTIPISVYKILKKNKND